MQGLDLSDFIGRLQPVRVKPLLAPTPLFACIAPRVIHVPTDFRHPQGARVASSLKMNPHSAHVQAALSQPRGGPNLPCGSQCPIPMVGRSGELQISNPNGAQVPTEALQLHGALEGCILQYFAVFCSIFLRTSCDSLETL